MPTRISFRRLLPRLAAVILSAGAVMALAAGAFAVPYSMLEHAGSGQPAAIELGPLAQRSYVYDAAGGLIAALKDEENRQPVRLADIPPHVVNAILAVEDAGFWIHDGYDVRGMLRAFRANVDSGGISQGGSTITQQLVKLNLLTSEQTLDRKVQEVVLAARLEKQMTKEEILDRYLNTVYFGNHAYGVQAAAETYFGVNVQQLDVGQAAMLAGIIRNPITYNPVRYPERAAERRDVAIDRLVDAGWLAEADAEWWHTAPTTPSFHQVLPKANDYFPSEVEQQLLNDPRFSMLGETLEERRLAVYRGGLKVYTTFDPTAQRQAITARDANLPLANGVFSQPGVNPETGHPNLGSAAIASIEPSTGAVRTMVGGPGFDGYKYNLATQNARGVGSSFKTFVLATIMDQGYSPDDIINGIAPCNFRDESEEGGVYDVSNFADGGGSLSTITDATLKSSNCAFVRLGMIAGMPNVAEMAYRLGIPRERPDVDGDGDNEPTICGTCNSSALGVASITPLEMASAYATLANDGVYNPPYLVDRIEDRDGNVIYTHTPAPEQRVAPETARLVTRVLQQNVQSGTGTRAQISGQPAAGKTGTNQDSTDAWFVGYTPALSTAVWVGGLEWNYEIRLNGTGITGGRFAAPVWGAFMNAWQQGRPTAGFPPAPSRPGGKTLTVPGGIDLSPPPAAPAPAPPAP
ncbi:MAG TPA: transglycosylase domain-containing protein, partial [Acidimicrobiales bacterium]|nr:transglycosylase domain-containing protein [Acidimicrobiales bacterium]